MACNKRPYKTKKEAQKAQYGLRTKEQRVNYYYCNDCGAYHITSSATGFLQRMDYLLSLS